MFGQSRDKHKDNTVMVTLVSSCRNGTSHKHHAVPPYVHTACQIVNSLDYFEKRVFYMELLDIKSGKKHKRIEYDDDETRLDARYHGIPRNRMSICHLSAMTVI